MNDYPHPAPPNRQPALIVGGGLGGLAAAIHLARQGRRVVLLEKNEQPGGKLSVVQREGYTFETGPSLLTMPWVVRDLFAAAGRDMAAYLDLVQLDPACRYCWPDGTRFDLSPNLPALAEAVRRLHPADVSGLLRFLGHTARIYDRVADVFLLHPFSGIRDLLTPQTLRDGLQIDALRSVDASLHAFFRSPHLRQVFNRYATYNGSSPYLLPATFNVIAFIEFIQGSWYIRGGMYQLVRALVRLAEELGVELHTGTEVREIVVREGQATGVLLRDGRSLSGECVIINADPRYAYRNLLPGQEATAATLERREPSCSGFMLLLGINRIYEHLAHHNIFFSSDYPREFAALFEKRIPAPDPTVYVCATSTIDPQHAPPGHMNLFVLVNAPALTARVCWQREAAGYRDTIVRKLERMGLDGLQQHIVTEELLTPLELWQRYYAAAGAIYGLASNDRFAAFLRPPLRARGIAALYFVGGGTHPGGGIPLVLLSGRAVAQNVAHDMPTL